MPDNLTFGYLYDFRNPPQWHQPWDTLYAETLEAIAWTEAAGFTGAWVPEHHLADDGYIPSPLVALAAIAARTSKIRLGQAIALAPLYNPVRFAEDSAVLDILSAGRLDTGLAIGYRAREYDAHGLDFTKRGRMFDEWLQIVTRLWDGETVTFQGEFYSIRDARIMPPSPRGRLPLYIGGFTDKSIERVTRYGRGYIGDPAAARLYRRKAGEQEPRIRITGLFLVVADDPEAAMEELAPYYLHVNNSYGEWFNEGKSFGRKQGLQPMTLEAYKASGILQILTPDAAIAMFRDMQARLPLEHYMMMKPPGLPTTRFLHYAETFAKKVIPAFQ